VERVLGITDVRRPGPGGEDGLFLGTVSYPQRLNIRGLEVKYGDVVEIYVVDDARLLITNPRTGQELLITPGGLGGNSL